MNDQIILAADDQGNFTGEYLPRMEGHIGEGKRHLGITILLFNDQGQVLLQRRKHLVFDDVWCFTADTHLLHQPDGHDESLEQAIKRCLAVEYNITQPVEIQNLGSYNYEATDGDLGENQQAVLCENEHCFMIIGEYNGQFELNPQVGYESKWMSKQQFLNDVTQNPQKYAPWIPGGIEILKQANFFN